MGYNYNCYSQYCWTGCCDYWGYCPTYSSDCYYYYSSDYSSSSTSSSTSSATATIIGTTVGPIMGIIFFVIIFTLIRRKCQRNNGEMVNNVNDNDGTTMIIVTDPNNPAYGQQVNNMNNTSSYQYNSYNNSPSIQPLYQAPINPYPQPYPYQQPPVYNPQPAYYNTPQPQQPIIIV